MTDAEAEEALAALEKHFKEPVLPLSRFCTAITTWFRAIERANEDVTLLRPGRRIPGSDYFQMLRKIERDIRKSNLLARLLYGKEQLRTVRCLTHNGHWTGDGECACEGTGWIKVSP